MKLNDLPTVRSKVKKRVGRGLGSGRGKTSGRGTKGQKARGSIHPGFIGGGLPLYRKLPLKRGVGNSKRTSEPKVVNLSQLSVLRANQVVDLDTLISANIIKERDRKTGVKILCQGQLKTPLVVKLPVSKSARQKIEKAGGKIDYA